MVKEIALKNFKAFLDNKIELKNLNLLTGINGLGKSTIIQVLLLLRQSYYKNVFPDKGVLLNGDLLNIGKGNDVLNIHSENEIINFKISLMDNLVIDLNLQYNQDSDFLPIIKSKSKISEKALKCNLFDNRFKYLNAERITPKVVYAVSLFEVEQNKSIGIHGENTSLFISRYQREPVKLVSTLHPDSSSNTLLDQISAWMGEISPGVSLSSRYFPEIDAAKFSYKYEYEKTFTPEFSPSNVGFGLTYILPVITCILSSEPGDMIIIENPESHLHPAGQAKLGELLFKASQNGVQLIIETHSDHILNGVRLEVNRQQKDSETVGIFYFERDKASDKHISTISSPHLDNNGRISSWPDGFFDQWEKSLIELI